MRIIFLVFFLNVFAWMFCFGQHLIGIEKNQLTSLVRKEMKGFNLDNSSKNQNFNYLKYLNAQGTKTLIVFFDDKNISTNTRLVCDYSEFDFVLKDLQKRYKKIDENNWEYTVENDQFIVNLEKKEWYFVVSVKKK